MADAAKAGGALPSDHSNIFDLVNAVRLEPANSAALHDHRSLQISAAISSPGFRSQHVIVESVATSSEVGIVSALALGFLRNQHEVSFSQIWELTDVEFSRVIESYCRFRSGGNILSTTTVENVVELSRRFIGALLRVFGATTSRSESGGKPTAHDILGTVVRFKRRALGYAGPDIASVF